jgi:hypothetical protein
MKEKLEEATAATGATTGAAPLSPVIAPAVTQALQEPTTWEQKLGAEPTNAADDPASTVIDLPAGIRAPSDVVYAVMAGSGDLTACPLRAPMCSEAGIAVNKEHRLVLVAVAGEDLAGIRAVAAALAWMNENRTLIAMALPQFAIDAMRPAMLRLLVDHAAQNEARADALAQMLQSDCVSIRTYRRLKWGGKTGLLLEAA